MINFINPNTPSPALAQTNLQRQQAYQQRRRSGEIPERRMVVWLPDYIVSRLEQQAQSQALTRRQLLIHLIEQGAGYE